MTLIERQNLIAQKGREEKEKRTASNNSLNRFKPEPDPIPLSPLEKRFQKKFGNARKGRVPINRKPLYPGGGGENPFKQKRSSSVPAKTNKVKKPKPKPK